MYSSQFCIRSETKYDNLKTTKNDHHNPNVVQVPLDFYHMAYLYIGQRLEVFQSQKFEQI